MQRIAQVVKLLPEKQDLYFQLHANPWKTINDKIKECNIQNYSIYFHDGYLFSYFEYVGNDYEKDMAKMAEHKETQIWWDLTKPCQQRLEGTPEGEQWMTMEEVYHLD